MDKKGRIDGDDEKEETNSKTQVGNFELSKMIPQLSQLTDRFGNTFYFGNVGDYWHPPFPIGSDNDFRSHVRHIRELEIRPDDVLLVSFPKTGTHWHMEIIKMLQKQKSEHVSDLDLALGFVDMTKHDLVDSAPSPRLLVTHVPFRHIPKQALMKKIKIIFLERNPKDVLVSYYVQLHSHVPPLNYPGTFEQFVHIYLECGFYYGDLFDYFLDWQQGMENNPDVDIFISVFEDMKLDPIGGVKKLNAYLGTGCSDQQCEDIALACSFKTLKTFKDTHMPEKLKDMFKKDKATFYRKGEVGDWKNWFTVALNEDFDQKYKKHMSNYKMIYKYTL